MRIVSLPPTCGIRALLRAMDRAEVFSRPWTQIQFDVNEGSFLFPSTISFLAAWGLKAVELDKEISFVGEQSTLRYLSRMDLFRCIGFDYEENFNRLNETGRFVPVMPICDQKSVLDAVNAICDLVIHQFPNGNEFVESMEWAINEVIDNILTHAESPTCGAVCAQYLPNRHKLRIGISDVGRGIRSSLSESYELSTHGEAISKAVLRGVTRNARIGQGNGLAGTYQIASLNRGMFNIFSGDVMFAADVEDALLDLPVSIDGTTVYLSLDTRRPVDLMDTFMAEKAKGWTYLDRECERLSEAGSVMVRSECVHVGGRPPAKALRQKLINLAPSYEGRMILDFKGCRPASSFLDELLGFMVDHYGQDRFLRKFEVRNLDEIHRRMAENVIAQRLAASDE